MGAIQGRNERGAPIEPARPQSFDMDMMVQAGPDGTEPRVEFKGYTQGQYWNGWACPYFPKDQADRVVAESIKLDEKYPTEPESGVPKPYFDAATDSFVFPQQGYPCEEGKPIPEEWDVFKGEDLQTTDGVVHVYAIGAFSWVWDEKEDLTVRCSCPGVDIDCGRTATKDGKCVDCQPTDARAQTPGCGHSHSPSFVAMESERRIAAAFATIANELDKGAPAGARSFSGDLLRKASERLLHGPTGTELTRAELISARVAAHAYLGFYHSTKKGWVVPSLTEAQSEEAVARLDAAVEKGGF